MNVPLEITKPKQVTQFMLILDKHFFLCNNLSINTHNSHTANSKQQTNGISQNVFKTALSQTLAPS